MWRATCTGRGERRIPILLRSVQLEGRKYRLIVVQEVLDKNDNKCTWLLTMGTCV